MRLLWLCNTQPGAVRTAIQGKPMGAVNWVDHVLEDLLRQGHEIRVLCPGDGGSGSLGGGSGYATFRRGAPHRYDPALEPFFTGQLRQWHPECVHIWGTEYGHTLALVRAAEAEGLLDRTVISIQGLCGVYARHYSEGLPEWVRRRFTIRDFLRQDNVRQQEKKYALRGQMESQALKTARHIIGRTQWDRACCLQINPELQYHFCNETLREPFYSGQWRYDACKKHQVFASSRAYPVKGFHYLLEAMALVRRTYPDATLAVTGESYLPGGLSRAVRREGYEQYLRRVTYRLGLENSIEFLGGLSAEGMKRAFLDCNVFALPSTIENSPNSLGEAMLLGVPCVASCVGGVQDLMGPEEGRIFQSAAPYMLAWHICELFAMEEKAAELGRRARARALKTHDPQTNLEQLLAVYGSLWGKEPSWKS